MSVGDIARGRVFTGEFSHRLVRALKGDPDIDEIDPKHSKERSKKRSAWKDLLIGKDDPASVAKSPQNNMGC